MAPSTPSGSAGHRPLESKPFAAAIYTLITAFRAARLPAVGIIIVTAVSGAAAPATAWLMAALLDDVSGAHAMPQSTVSSVLFLALALGVIGMVVSLIPHLRRTATDRMQRSLALVLQDRLCQAVNMWSGLGRFEDPEFIDRLQLAQQASVGPASQLINNLSSIVQASITAASFLVVLVVVNPILALLVVGAASPGLFVQLARSRRRIGLLWRLSPVVRRQGFFRALQTQLEAAKEVRLFGLGEFFRNRMIRELQHEKRENERHDLVDLVAQGGLAVIGASVAAGGVAWTAIQAASGHLSVGDISLFIMAAGGVSTTVWALTLNVASLQHNLHLMRQYLGVIRTGPDLEVRQPRLELEPLTTGIEICDVWFRYAPDLPWVLHGLNLMIPYGTSLALIGLNGAGKTTIVKLLCRFYQPERGCIRWDGVDIRHFDPRELREKITVVFQDYMTYDLSASENIGIGALDRLDDRAAVGVAASYAGIHEAIQQLPRAYDTLLSRQFADETNDATDATGVVLSGGQWQRIAFARAMMRSERDFLILDEPTSGLDPSSESDMQARVRALRAGRTSLIISHRLGTVRAADQIVVLTDGAVLERGTHEELLARGGEYQRLFTLQASDYQLDAQTSPPSEGNRAASMTVGKAPRV